MVGDDRATQDLLTRIQGLTGAQQRHILMSTVNQMNPGARKEVVASSVTELPDSDRKDVVTNVVNEMSANDRKDLVTSTVSGMSAKDRKDVVTVLGSVPRAYAGPVWVILVSAFSLVLVGGLAGIIYLIVSGKDTKDVLPVITAAVGVLAGLMAPSPTSQSSQGGG